MFGVWDAQMQESKLFDDIINGHQNFPVVSYTVSSMLQSNSSRPI